MILFQTTSHTRIVCLEVRWQIASSSINQKNYLLVINEVKWLIA